jgi:GT2 family glycosyltransferase
MYPPLSERERFSSVPLCPYGYNSPVDISVITVTYNRERDLRRSLRSVWRQVGVEIEMIVADNGSSDGTLPMLRQDEPRVRLIEMGANTGMRAHNRAIREAKSDIVFLLDNDMLLVEDDALARACQFLRNDPKLAAAACCVWEIDRAQGKLALKLSGNSPKHLATGEPEAGFETSAFDGGGAAFRRSALIDAGLFCEEFFLYHGEVDLTTRLLNLGWQVRYFPQISVIHCHSQVQRSSSLHSYLATRNYYWYLYRNYPAWKMMAETLRYSRQSAWQVIRGQRSFFPWLRGMISGVIGAPRIPGRRPVRNCVFEHQQEIREADRRRKESTGEMNVSRPLSEAELVKFDLLDA